MIMYMLEEDTHRSIKIELNRTKFLLLCFVFSFLSNVVKLSLLKNAKDISSCLGRALISFPNVDSLSVFY